MHNFHTIFTLPGISRIPLHIFCSHISLATVASTAYKSLWVCTKKCVNWGLLTKKCHQLTKNWHTIAHCDPIVAITFGVSHPFFPTISDLHSSCRISTSLKSFVIKGSKYQQYSVKSFSWGHLWGPIMIFHLMCAWVDQVLLISHLTTHPTVMEMTILQKNGSHQKRSRTPRIQTRNIMICLALN